MKDLIKTCNPTVGFSKFTFNKNILDKFIGFLTKLVWRETFYEKAFLPFEFSDPIQLLSKCCFKKNLVVIF